MSGHNEEKLDAWLREQLRAGLPAPPVEEVDWAALRQRIARRAEPQLARLRRSARAAAWWDYAARWAMPALPAAVAAAALLALLLGRMQSAPQAQTSETVASAQRLTVESAIGASPQDEETSVLFASADRDDLLRAAVTGR
jgi:hypothetical protein